MSGISATRKSGGKANSTNTVTNAAFNYISLGRNAEKRSKHKEVCWVVVFLWRISFVEITWKMQSQTNRGINMLLKICFVRFFIFMTRNVPESTV